MSLTIVYYLVFVYYYILYVFSSLDHVLFTCFSAILFILVSRFCACLCQWRTEQSETLPISLSRPQKLGGPGRGHFYLKCIVPSSFTHIIVNDFLLLNIQKKVILRNVSGIFFFT